MPGFHEEVRKSALELHVTEADARRVDEDLQLPLRIDETDSPEHR